jgi:hypothetical protein
MQASSTQLLSEVEYPEEPQARSELLYVAEKKKDIVRLFFFFFLIPLLYPNIYPQ